MNIIEQINQWLLYYSNILPVELFTIIGSFVEEVIAPVPSPLVMTAAGAVAQAQQKSWLYLVWLAILGAFAKTLGGWLLYFLADAAEDLIIGKFGGFIGVEKGDIEAIGQQYLKGSRANAMLMIIRSTPVFPSAPVSVICGAIKFNFKPFMVITFLGSIIRGAFFLYFGYASLYSFELLIHQVDRIENFFTLLIAIGLGALIAYFYYQRGRGNLLQKIGSRVKKENTIE